MVQMRRDRAQNVIWTASDTNISKSEEIICDRIFNFSRAAVDYGSIPIKESASNSRPARSSQSPSLQAAAWRNSLSEHIRPLPIEFLRAGPRGPAYHNIRV